MATRMNVADLAELAQDCFHRALDGRIPADRRKQFLELGEALNDRLGSLVAKKFDERTDAFKSANEELKAVNLRVKAEIDNIASLEQTLADIAKVLGVVDKLVAIAMVL